MEEAVPVCQLKQRSGQLTLSHTLSDLPLPIDV